MLDEVKACLFDIVQACDLILDFAAEKSLTSYKEDVRSKSAVERQFQIIGEAVNRLAKKCPEVVDQIPSHRAIISFRNMLVHGYDRIEDEIVWGVIRKHLPALRSTVSRMLGDEDDTG